MKHSFFINISTVLSFVILASSCEKEKQVDIPYGNWESFMTEYSFAGTTLDPYSAHGTASVEKIIFEESGACTVTINGVDRTTSFSTSGNTLTIDGYGDFRLVQNTGLTLILGVKVTGDDSATSVFEYKRGSEDNPLTTIYSNYTTFDGTDKRIFWYFEGKEKVFCKPIVSSKYFDLLYSEGKTLYFYDEMLIHFKKRH